MPKSSEEKRAMNRARVEQWRKANPEYDKSYRKKCEEGGLKEVRGIWAKPERHSMHKVQSIKLNKALDYADKRWR